MVHKGIEELFKKQEQERMAFCGFVSDPKDIRVAIRKLTRRFKDIDADQLSVLLNPWFPNHEIVKSAGAFFWRQPAEDTCWYEVRIPRAQARK